MVLRNPYFIKSGNPKDCQNADLNAGSRGLKIKDRDFMKDKPHFSFFILGRAIFFILTKGAEMENFLRVQTDRDTQLINVRYIRSITFIGGETRVSMVNDAMIDKQSTINVKESESEIMGQLSE